MVQGYVVIQKKNGSDGPQYPVHADIKIGRGTHCGIRIHIQSVSEEHCLICVEKGKRAQVKNLSSSSTTLVNGVSVGASLMSLQHGDIISVGGRAFRWVYPSDSQYFKESIVLPKRRKSAEAARRGFLLLRTSHKRHTLGAPVSSPGSSSLHTKAHLANQEIKPRSSSRTPISKSKTPTPLSTKVSTPASVRTSKRKLSIRNSSGQTPKTSALKKTKTLASSATKSRPSKRRLSTPSASAAKRMKIESPKTIDKKKMAALIGIHRKSPWVPISPSRKAKSVALSSSKPGRTSQTPNQRRLKTPGGSSKKSTAWGVTSGTRRPLFSEILKRAKKIANAAPKKSIVQSFKKSKRPLKPQPPQPLLHVIPKSFHFNSTGHANSPEPIIIGRKITVTPAVTRKGRKEICFPFKDPRGETVDLDGLNNLFKTPSKIAHAISPQKSPVTVTTHETLSPPLTSKLAEDEKIKIARISPELQQKTVVVSVSHKGSPKMNVLLCTENVSSPIKQLKSSIRSRSVGNSHLCVLKQNESRQSLPHYQKSAVNSSSPLSTRQITHDIDPKAENVKLLRKKESLDVTVGKSTPGTRSKLRSPMQQPSASKSSAKKKSPCVTSTPAPSSINVCKVSNSWSQYSPYHTSDVSDPENQISVIKSSPAVSPLNSQKTPVKSSLKSSPSKGDSPSRGKSLSVSFNDSVQYQNDANMSGDCEEKSGCNTPDVTFDFNSVKTPNVPREMFVSSLFSSSSLSSGCSAGSARRKGISLSGSGGLRGIRRLMKTPLSPAGYVDVSGIKRLMTSPCKTPTYLAVEGVKKLFGDAAASAQNSLSSFVGVKELFSSPPMLKGRSGGTTPEVCNSEADSESKLSSVAKILAEVEGKSTLISSSAQSSNKTPIDRATRSSTSVVSHENKMMHDMGFPFNSNAHSSEVPSRRTPRQVVSAPKISLNSKDSPKATPSTAEAEDSTLSMEHVDVSPSTSGRGSAFGKGKKTKRVVQKVPSKPKDERSLVSPVTAVRATKRKAVSPLVVQNVNSELSSIKCSFDDETSSDTVKLPKGVQRSKRKASTPVKCPSFDSETSSTVLTQKSKGNSISNKPSPVQGVKRSRRGGKSPVISPVVDSKISPAVKSRRLKRKLSPLPDASAHQESSVAEKVSKDNSAIIAVTSVLDSNNMQSTRRLRQRAIKQPSLSLEASEHDSKQKTEKTLEKVSAADSETHPKRRRAVKLSLDDQVSSPVKSTRSRRCKQVDIVSAEAPKRKQVSFKEETQKIVKDSPTSEDTFASATKRSRRRGDGDSVPKTPKQTRSKEDSPKQTRSKEDSPEQTRSKQGSPKQTRSKQGSPKQTRSKQDSPKKTRSKQKQSVVVQKKLKSSPVKGPKRGVTEKSVPDVTVSPRRTRSSKK